MIRPRGRQHTLGRGFWLYFGGQLVSQVGSSFTSFAFPLLVFKLTGSATGLALSTAANLLPYLLFGLVLGAVVDRVDRRRMMLWTDVARAAVIVVLPVLALSGELRVADIYAVAFVQSTLGILFNCGEFAAVPSLVGQDDLVAANGRIMATNSAGQIIGPILRGIPGWDGAGAGGGPGGDAVAGGGTSPSTAVTVSALVFPVFVAVARTFCPVFSSLMATSAPDAERTLVPAVKLISPQIASARPVLSSAVSFGRRQRTG